MTPEDSSSDPPVLLTHPPFCPVLQLTSREAEALPLDIRERGVNVGVVAILGRSDMERRNVISNLQFDINV